MAIELNAELRKDVGTGVSKRLRREDIVPAVVYGKEIKNTTIQVQAKDVEKILCTKLGKNTLIDLKVSGDQDYKVLIRDLQGRAISRKITHVDFWSVKEDQKVEVMVETKLQGKAPGLLKGGLIDHTHRQVRLQCAVSAIPEELIVDINQLDLGQNIHLADITLPEGVERMEDYNPTIVSLKEPKEEVVEEVATAEGEEGAAEGEVPAEGDAKAEGAAEAKPEEKKE